MQKQVLLRNPSVREHLCCPFLAKIYQFPLCYELLSDICVSFCLGSLRIQQSDSEHRISLNCVSALGKSFLVFVSLIFFLSDKEICATCKLLLLANMGYPFLVWILFHMWSFLFCQTSLDVHQIAERWIPTLHNLNKKALQCYFSV